MDSEESLTKSKRTIDFWWNNYIYIYMKCDDLFRYYNLKANLNGFIELGINNSIRDMFRNDNPPSINYKTIKIKEIYESEIVRKIPKKYQIKIPYFKVINFFCELKLYKTLAFILTAHNFILNKIKEDEYNV